ncbi:hypothetical protein GCM10010123_17570 [Pilimelia anulata]|uniref:Fibronectin type-III domain-containing protein n=1 Tax=Pilimelia anulata TaxID=53371 RepID=A0A8J3F8N3_9ACTN|nr:Ig-like domain-containing protein [Pilimelia anulata]GGJ88465.1 hypothetical protein GCM10010123_17570 [Pilimelia anulata]
MIAPRIGKRGRALAAAVTAALATLTVAGPAAAGLPVVGPENNVKNFPLYVEDGNGLRLSLCDDPAAGCGLAAEELPNPDAPMSFPDNYAAENFYFYAGSAINSGGVTGELELTLETGYLNDAPIEGDEMMFARAELDNVEGLQPNSTYRIMHPYGDFTVVSDGDGDVDRISHHPETGCGPAEPGEAGEEPEAEFGQLCGPEGYNAAAAAFLGDAADLNGDPQTPAPFVTWDPIADAPAGHIGDPATPHAITGSIVADDDGAAQNYFRIVGPGVDVRQTLFTLQGRIAPVNPGNPPTTPNVADGSDSGWSHLDNVTSDTTPTVAGRASGGTVELLADGRVVATAPVSGRAYEVTVPAAESLGDGQHTLSVRNGDEVSGDAAVTVDTAAPAAPAMPNVAPTSGDTATLSWDGVPGAERYTAYRDGVEGETTMVADIGWGGATEIADLRGRITGHAISATDEAGNTSGRSPARLVGVPSRVTAKSVAGSSRDRLANATVSWSSASPHGAAITAYRVTAIRSGTGARVTKGVRPALRRHAFPGLERNVRYRFVVTPVNAFGPATPSYGTPWTFVR